MKFFAYFTCLVKCASLATNTCKFIGAVPLVQSTPYTLSISNLVNKPSFIAKRGIWILDRLLGIARMNKLYHLHQMQGLSKEDFADKLISLLDLNITGIQELQQKIPKTGPVVIASNHPFGGIEGVILARVIGEVRPDLKVLANKGLGIFRELKDYFIFTNPLSERDPQNGPSLRKCIKHVQNQGALLIFPAGRVSYYQNDKKAISEHTWNKIVGRLVSIERCQFVPVFVNGSNSKWFYRLGRVYYRLRMLMLARELLNKTGTTIGLNAGYPVKAHAIKGTDYQQKSDFCRLLSYTQDNRWKFEWPPNKVLEQKPLMAPIDRNILATELSALPTDQLLINTNEYKVFFGYQEQFPNVVREIARLRELVFRQYNEGSGEPLDTDAFDATYTHLFIVNNDTKIMGAYRMGRTDVLIESGGLEALYLHKMFKFSPEFVNRKTPCLEMGRSFLIPEFQGSFQGLLLLWRGICAFIKKHPQYRTLYGTVSISKLYDPRSVKLIEAILIKEGNGEHVAPSNAFDFKLHPEFDAFDKLQSLPTSLASNLGALLCAIEHDSKDIPVLAKQYLKMGANYHALGIDTNFNHTPGLLLSVHMPSAPTKQLKLYMGENFAEYVNYDDACEAHVLDNK
jgi:putative hemolysin